jgi:hypothetical protein
MQQIFSQLIKGRQYPLLIGITLKAALLNQF